MYSGSQNILFSVLLAGPGLLGVEAGIVLRKKILERYFYKASLLLMTVIGFKLLGTF
jgi:hypothetical protein